MCKCRAEVFDENAVVALVVESGDENAVVVLGVESDDENAVVALVVESDNGNAVVALVVVGSGVGGLCLSAGKLANLLDRRRRIFTKNNSTRTRTMFCKLVLRLRFLLEVSRCVENLDVACQG